MIRILRLSRPTKTISAGVFDDLFKKHLGEVFDIGFKPLVEWCETVLGPSDSPFTIEQSSELFAMKTQGYDFFCPSYECICLAPIFAALRNASKSDTRFLLIAHAPGVYAMEWVLLHHLMLPGDLIIAPSRSARATIEFMYPELSPFIRVINHPIHRLAAEPRAIDDVSDMDRIVTMSRIEETKLIHRQIEAMALLRGRGLNQIRMDIAGPIHDAKTNQPTEYAHSLYKKIDRLGLKGSVTLIGLVESDHAKASFLSGAKMLVSLSQTVEEAFPKVTVEALGMGIPVVGARWNGFLETVGDAGVLVSFYEIRDGHIDIRAADVADAIEMVLNIPITTEVCLRQADKFSPEKSKGKYLRVLQESLKELPSNHANEDALIAKMDKPFSSKGLLGDIACLKPFTWQELFEFCQEINPIVRKSWEGWTPQGSGNGDQLYWLVLSSIRRPLEYFLAGFNCQPWRQSFGSSDIPVNYGKKFCNRIANSIYSRSNQNSKEMCLFHLYNQNRIDLLQECLRFIQTAGTASRGFYFLKINLLLLQGHFKQALALFNSNIPRDTIDESETPFLSQVALIYRKLGTPDQALYLIRRWLEKYPDSPKSGFIWIEKATNAYLAGRDYLPEAAEALWNAKELMGKNEAMSNLAYDISLAFSGISHGEKIDVQA